MARYDVFNGDADGICALVQLRLADPGPSQLITGVKRDISLLKQVQASAGDQVTVLDISLDKNRADLQRVLDAGAEVFYVDHHFAGEIPQSDRLRSLINEAPDVCTSLLVNGHLGNRYRGWAVVGAYGDNLKRSAAAIAAPMQLDAEQLEQLEWLGIYINYNGYGARVEDLHFAPEALYQRLVLHADPFAFIREGRAHFEKLSDGYRSDMAKAAAIVPEASSTDAAALLMLPNAAWARRVTGVYSNDLTNLHPDRAHAVLTEQDDGGYLVSVRAPLNRKQGADVLCRKFATGGGRAAAAGINALPADQLGSFVDAFVGQYG